jgi:hypothetical protein
MYPGSCCGENAEGHLSTVVPEQARKLAPGLRRQPAQHPDWSQSQRDRDDNSGDSRPRTGGRRQDSRACKQRGQHHNPGRSR